ncbi:hypothetical protein VZ95_08165 [Elstera litoralis]|uniref:Uncharacterized protein n=1 Tax=Elstera litoralis TaxID=552518 RepID=A0A0F3ITK0_9PROT|nr:hypothetical protein VZ95_08165 [Elstera litoralis]
MRNSRKGGVDRAAAARKFSGKNARRFIDLYVQADLRPPFEGRTSVRRYFAAAEPQEAYRLAAEARLELERQIRFLEDPAHDQRRLTAFVFVI